MTMTTRGGGAVVLLVAVLFFAGMTPAVADDAKPPGREVNAPSTAPTPPARVETRHTIQLGQRSIDYRAIAETIQLSNAKGEKTASVFTIAYLVDAKPGQTRPVAFFFNGGPGARGGVLHSAA